MTWFRLCISRCLIGILILSATPIDARTVYPAGYLKALELIHSFSGAGDELRQALSIAQSLLKSDPKSGMGQTLQAEALSTWRLDDPGEPVEVRDMALALTQEALSLDPGLAQAHVARARTLLRMRDYAGASASLDAAFKIDDKLPGAFFLRAELYEAARMYADAEQWYLKFIAATPNVKRQSNGYAAIASMYRDAAHRQVLIDRDANLRKAADAYEQMSRLDPAAAWKEVNYAAFLNEHMLDFDGAEKHALQALAQMPFRAAQLQLAAARFQRIGAKAKSMPPEELQKTVDDIGKAGGITLADAYHARGFNSGVMNRLANLHNRLNGVILD